MSDTLRPAAEPHRTLHVPQDDAHIFCLPSQLTAEIKSTLELVQKTMGAFGFTKLEVGRQALHSQHPPHGTCTAARGDVAAYGIFSHFNAHGLLLGGLAS